MRTGSGEGRLCVFFPAVGIGGDTVGKERAVAGGGGRRRAQAARGRVWDRTTQLPLQTPVMACPSTHRPPLPPASFPWCVSDVQTVTSACFLFLNLKKSQASSSFCFLKVTSFQSKFRSLKIRHSVCASRFRRYPQAVRLRWANEIALPRTVTIQPRSAPWSENEWRLLEHFGSRCWGAQGRCLKDGGLRQRFVWELLSSSSVI